MSFYTIIGAIGTGALTVYAIYVWVGMRRQNAKIDKLIEVKLEAARMKEQRRLLGSSESRTKHVVKETPKSTPDLPDWWTKP